MRRFSLVLAAAFLASPASADDGTRFPSARSAFHAVTDADLATLASPEKLETVVLRGTLGYGIDRVTDDGIAHLARCTRLRVLSAGALGLTDRALEAIGKIASLEELNLDSNKITGTGLHHLRNLKKLRRLNLDFDPLRPEAFATLATLTGLTRLTVYSGPAVDDAVLEQCAKLTKLEELRLSENTRAVTDRGLEHLARLKELRNVKLFEAEGVTDAGLARLAGLPHLEELSLRGLRSVTPRGMDVLARLPELRRLEIDYVPMDGRCLRSLGALTKLETLLLWSVGPDPTPAEALAGLRSLRRFRTNQAVPSAAVQALAGLRHLEAIADELREVTDEDLKHLARLPKLRLLILASDRVTAASLPTLAGMTSLRELYVTEKVAVRPEEWERLGRSSLTRCKIARFRPPYTVYHQPGDPGAAGE